MNAISIELPESPPRKFCVPCMLVWTSPAVFWVALFAWWLS